MPNPEWEEARVVMAPFPAGRIQPIVFIADPPAPCEVVHPVTGRVANGILNRFQYKISYQALSWPLPINEPRFLNNLGTP